MWWLGEFKTSVSSSLDTIWILDLDVTFGGPWAFCWPTFGAGTPPPTHTHTHAKGQKWRDEESILFEESQPPFN